MQGHIGRAAISRRLARGDLLAAAVAWAVAVGCHGVPVAAFTDLAEARHLAADLRVQFNKASNASDRAVLADTDEASVAFARDADQFKVAMQTDLTALGPRLRSLNYAVELGLLEGFEGHLAEYEKIDHDVLVLAVENTNLKAQRLSFGPARDAADAFRDALASVAAHAAANDRCRVDGLVAKAVLAVVDEEILQAPHIAESDDEVMTRLEGRMAASSAAARDAVQALEGLADPQARAEVATAAEALGRFEATSKEIVTLSRRNSNVRSLEISIRRKPVIATACDESLRGLEDALAKEAFTATR